MMTKKQLILKFVHNILYSGISAALVWKNGRSYFFHDDHYYRFDDRQFKIDTSDTAEDYPRSTSKWWFGCTDNYSHQVAGSNSWIDSNSFFDDESLHVYAIDE